jgi:hypothetical protein
MRCCVGFFMGTVCSSSGAGGAQPILQIVDDKRLRLAVPIPEAQVGEMKAGQLVSINNCCPRSQM